MTELIIGAIIAILIALLFHLIQLNAQGKGYHRIRIYRKRSKIRVLILAAGKSQRWIASIKHNEDEKFYSYLFWENINHELEEMAKGSSSEISAFRINKPTPLTSFHKSCAILRRRKESYAVLKYTIENYHYHGFINISIVTSEGTDGEKNILHYISDWNVRSKSKKENVKSVSIPNIGDIASSLYHSFKGIPDHYQEDLLVCYSDIIWEKILLRKLISKKHEDADIVFLVDSNWKDNYPTERIWHDKLNAELVFGQGERIERIGEAINRFDGIPEIYTNVNRDKIFGEIFEHNCIGEIIGLFKFSRKGRLAYMKTYDQIEKSGNNIIPIEEWKIQNLPSYLKPKIFCQIEKALLGCFLEYLYLHNDDLKIKPIQVEDGWGEIDHIGDLCIVENRLERINPKNIKFK